MNRAPAAPQYLRGDLWVVALVVAAVIAALGAAASGKVAFYLEALERSNLLYAVPLLVVPALVGLLAFPRLAMCLMAFLLPFNFVGGYWGSHIVVLVAKIAVNVLAVAALLATFLAPARDRAWLVRTRLGAAVLIWLGMIAMGVTIGFLSAPSREYWLRESAWMLFYSAALPVGTLLTRRRDIAQLLWWMCAGIATLQAYAFWMLVFGTRYARADAWEAGATFFRAPYSSVSLFALYLAAATLLFASSARTLTRRSALLLFPAIAIMAGGLLASMVRSLWLSGAFGLMVLLMLVPWDRRTMRAVLAVASGAILAVVIVAAVDRLSPGSSGNWTASALTFLMDLGSKESTSRVTREIEWGHAIEVWKQSPLVGLGFGYSFPQDNFVKIPVEIIPEPFYMHNSYLNILAKVGIFGLAAFLYLIGRTGISAYLALRHGSAALSERILAAAVLASLASVALLTTTMPVLTAGDPAAYFGVLVGLTAALRRAQLAE